MSDESWYITYYPFGEVLDSYRFPRETEEEFVQNEIRKGAIKIARRADGVILYEQPSCPDQPLKFRP